MKKLALNLLIISLMFISQGYGQAMKEILVEDFNNNSLKWDIDNESNYSSTIKNGTYVLKNTSGSSLAWANSIVLPILRTTKSDFLVEIQNGFLTL